MDVRLSPHEHYAKDDNATDRVVLILYTDVTLNERAELEELNVYFYFVRDVR